MELSAHPNQLPGKLFDSLPFLGSVLVPLPRERALFDDDAIRERWHVRLRLLSPCFDGVMSS